MITYTSTVKADQEEVLAFEFTDSIGNSAPVDGGIRNITLTDGGAEVVLDPTDATGKTLIVRSDITSGSFPTTSTVNAEVDVDMGSEVKTLAIVLTVVTNAAEAVAANVTSGGLRPRGTTV